MRRKRTDSLIQWKKSPSRKPLILQGLRQTGKTWLLLDFGSKQYENTLYINLETDKPAADYLSIPHDPQEALLFLETYADKPLRPSTSLLILDNLQCVPQISTLLAGIALDFPHYHIAAIKKGVYPDPDYTSNDFDILTLYPMDFEEFLWANAEFALAREIRAHFFRLHFHGKIPACKSTSPVSPLPDHRRNTAFCSGIQKRKKLTDGSRYSAENPRPLSGRHYCLCPKRNRHTQPQKLAFHPLSAWKKQPQIPVHPNRQRCHCQNLSGISQLADPFRPCPLLPRLRKN